MPVVQDEEFGKIVVRRSAKATQVRVRVAPDGSLRASLPLYAPLFLVKRLLKTSRSELRMMLAQATPSARYESGMKIGKSHTLIVREGSSTLIQRHGQHIIATLPPHENINDPAIAKQLRDETIAALRIEAKSYLPKRLAFLAQKYEYSYEKVRFSHASGRWGSCSSSGTISLNIALMKLPFELIDYVLLHELAHTRHMNHSQAFWSQVAIGDPQYALHRKKLALENPTI